ncbi:hypothetical protein [Amycolatopsis palatopharyngis]|uniref:hypothetical protein n=1 Tax=Amycolatopsis palatopharyngis TaxID=187982 RepID=UPI000E245D14|nr:hypothetical protein [Amycolatopsis palatopharyngis]
MVRSPDRRSGLWACTGAILVCAVLIAVLIVSIVLIVLIVVRLVVGTGHTTVRHIAMSSCVGVAGCGVPAH